MSGLFRLGLAALSARRAANVFTCVCITAVLAIAVSTRDASAAHFGLARQHVWAAFLLAAAPLLLLRTAQRAAPMSANDAAWLATKSASNSSIALSTWLGVFVPWCLATFAFALAGDLGAPPGEKRLVAVGSFEVPTGVWASNGAPLAWKAGLTHGAEIELATFEVGIGSPLGSATRVAARWRGSGSEWHDTSGAWIGSRGEMTVDLTQAAPGTIEFELVCVDEGTRAVVLSPVGTLWKRADSGFLSGMDIALLLVLAGAVWLALALLLACFVGATTAACSVPALWIPVWIGDWPTAFSRWIPGANLFDALAIVGSGRAPGVPAIHAWIGAFIAALGALVATAIALRRWRVSR